MMNKDEVEESLRTIAQTLKLREPEISVEKPGRWIHVLIASPDFEGKTAGERENVVWRELERVLDDETLLAITQCYLLTPEERSLAMPA